ncbi:Increased DNA methylation 1 [Nymphaea thermarum]|nr:Increased DNA methylation 1 [Nymphaea thermarum]
MLADGPNVCGSPTREMGAPAKFERHHQLHDDEDPGPLSSNKRYGKVIDKEGEKDIPLMKFVDGQISHFQFNSELHTDDYLVYDIDSRAAEADAYLLVNREQKSKNGTPVGSHDIGSIVKLYDRDDSMPFKSVKVDSCVDEISGREHSTVEDSSNDVIQGNDSGFKGNDGCECKPSTGLQGSHDGLLPLSGCHKVESCSGVQYGDDAINSFFMAAMENLSKDFNRGAYETNEMIDSDESKCSVNPANCNMDDQSSTLLGEVENRASSDAFSFSEQTNSSMGFCGSSDALPSKESVGVCVDGKMQVSDVDVTERNNAVQSCPNKKLELKMSKKVAVTKIPSNVTAFLGTGLLDGCPVRYINPGEQKILHGTIKDGGFLCSCSSCNGSKIVTALDFERHAGCLTKHAYSYIFVPNGMRLYTAVRKLRDASRSMLDEMVRSITGLAPKDGHASHCDGKELIQPPIDELPRFRRKRKMSQHSPDDSYVQTRRRRVVPRRFRDNSYVHTDKKCSVRQHYSNNSCIQERKRKVLKHSSDNLFAQTAASTRPSLSIKISGPKVDAAAFRLEQTNDPQISVEETEQRKIKLRISMKTSPKDSVSICAMQKAETPHDAIGEKLPELVKASDPKDFDPKENVSISSMLHSSGHAVGKKKKKDTSLHKLIFMSNGLPDGTELAYYIRGKKLLEGYKQRNGIVCSCCNAEVSPSQFEAHAGWASRRQPYHYIFTSSGLSLHEICVSLSKGQKLTASYNDDLCTMCGESGDLLLCDSCPRAFHAGCLEEQKIHDGSWYCPYCKDKAVHGSTTFGGESQINAVSGSNFEEKKRITIRCKRVIKMPTTDIGGCVVCRAHDFSKGKFDERTVMLCDQCEKEFHVGCLRESGLCDLKALPRGKWFCNGACSDIHSALHQLIASGPVTLPDAISSIIDGKCEEKNLNLDVVNVKWQLLSGRIASPNSRVLLSRAAAIFRDCFDPIIEMSGRDLIPSMVYGRNIGGREFGGMFCIVLIVNSVVVSAGVLRIFGHEVAELPLVATRRENQGQGYFQSLFSCIGSLLANLNVKNLVLPAAEGAEAIWTKKFGFNKLSDEELRRYTRDLPMMVFQGTSMLAKELSQPQICCSGPVTKL